MTMNDLREQLGLQPLPAEMNIGTRLTPESELLWERIRTGILRKEDVSAEMVIYIPLKPEGY